jgi:DUF4097 and DUF4098 domain-containing protein YvlB
MACEIHIGDVGTRFLFTIQDCDDVNPLDVSTASSIEIIFKKPDSSTLTVTATFLTDGTDGKVYYDTVAGDIDQVGRWQVQGKVTFPTGVFYSDIHKFQVYANL